MLHSRHQATPAGREPSPWQEDCWGPGQCLEPRMCSTNTHCMCMCQQGREGGSFPPPASPSHPPPTGARGFSHPTPAPPQEGMALAVGRRLSQLPTPHQCNCPQSSQVPAEAVAYLGRETPTCHSCPGSPQWLLGAIALGLPEVVLSHLRGMGLVVGKLQGDEAPESGLKIIMCDQQLTLAP